MRTRSITMLIFASMALAKPASDIAVTSNLADFDANNAAYYVQSDGHGSYSNGVGATTSILVAMATTASRGGIGGWTCPVPPREPSGSHSPKPMLCNPEIPAIQCRPILLIGERSLKRYGWKTNVRWITTTC